MSDQKSIRQQDEEIERKRQEEEELGMKLELESNKQQQRQIKQQLKEFENQHNDEKEETPKERRKRQQKEFERQQHETEEEKQTRIEREVRELEEKFNLPHLPQRQQPKKISELTLEQHDQLLSFILSTNDRMLGYKVCAKLPIVDIIDRMESFVPRKYKMKIKEIGEKNGNFAATERFMLLAITKKLKIGWSRQLIQTVTDMNIKDVEELISPKQADLEEFDKQGGIPLLIQLADKLRAHCGILISPMGKDYKDSEDVPVVHPELCVSEDHFRTNSGISDETYKPSEEARNAYRYAPRISFNDVTKSNGQTSDSTNKYSSVMRKHHGLFLFLIGIGGSGKTTITKRMVKTWIEENKMAFLIPFAQIDKNQRQSLKTLLTKFICQLHNLNHDPSEKEIDETFQWILDNQDKCLLVFDGLDQSSFDISNQPIEDPDINDEFLPEDLISLLMSRKFLPNCRLVLASRPHSLAQFAPVIQPNIVVFLNELLSNDVEKLMNYYLQQHGTASGVMKKLRTKSPRIYQLIFTPLFLRLVVMLNNEAGEHVWTYVNTTAKLFFEVIKRLQMSAHHEYGLDVGDVEILNQKVAEMAFNKTKQGSVVFQQNDLERYGLSGENVQDFLFGVLSSNTALLVGLGVVFYFNNQTTQEFFSARFAVEKLAVGEFKKLVEKLFPRLEKNEDGDMVGVGEDSFAMLRVFVVGCINEINQIDEEEILVKKNIFVNYLSYYIRQLFGNHNSDDDVKEHQKKLITDLLDLREDGICNELRESLKDINFRFFYRVGSSLEDVTIDLQNFLHFIQTYTSKVERFSFTICEWNEKEGQQILESIKDASSKIDGEKEVWMKSQLFNEDVIAILSKSITRLMVELNGDDDDDRICRQFKEKISYFDTSKLQTQEFLMKIHDVSINFEVILRWGEPPQFFTD